MIWQRLELYVVVLFTVTILVMCFLVGEWLDRGEMFKKSKEKTKKLDDVEK